MFTKFRRKFILQVLLLWWYTCSTAWLVFYSLVDVLCCARCHSLLAWRMAFFFWPSGCLFLHYYWFICLSFCLFLMVISRVTTILIASYGLSLKVHVCLIFLKKSFLLDLKTLYLSVIMFIHDLKRTYSSSWFITLCPNQYAYDIVCVRNIN